MRVKIDKHDIDFKARTARKLLAGGDKVKVSVMFRAREITHPEVGRDLLDRFYKGDQRRRDHRSRAEHGGPLHVDGAGAREGRPPDATPGDGAAEEASEAQPVTGSG